MQRALEVASHPKQTTEISHLRTEVRTALSGLEETFDSLHLHLRVPLGQKETELQCKDLDRESLLMQVYVLSYHRGCGGVRGRGKQGGPIHLN